MLENPSQRLKEQTVGIEVFGRPPGYDTNRDHIVRSTAVEIRRRLKQYYSDPEHRDELVITLPAGWYTPQFLTPESFIAATGSSLQNNGAIPDSMGKLWSPLIEESDFVFVCISPLVFHEAAESYSEPETVADMALRDRNRVALVDAVSMSRFVSFLSAYGVAAQIWGSHELTIDQFNRAPVILIGALNNKWTVRFTASLRFRFCFDEQSATVWVYDQETPDAPVGSLGVTRLVDELEQDFAIVTRLMDQAIGKPMLAVGGITILGTSAAAEFITNPLRVAEIERNAPAGWQTMNFQLLLSVHIVCLYLPRRRMDARRELLGANQVPGRIFLGTQRVHLLHSRPLVHAALNQFGNNTVLCDKRSVRMSGSGAIHIVLIDQERNRLDLGSFCAERLLRRLVLNCAVGNHLTDCNDRCENH